MGAAPSWNVVRDFWIDSTDIMLEYRLPRRPFSSLFLFPFPFFPLFLLPSVTLLLEAYSLFSKHRVFFLLPGVRTDTRTGAARVPGAAGEKLLEALVRRCGGKVSLCREPSLV